MCNTCGINNKEDIKNIINDEIQKIELDLEYDKDNEFGFSTKKIIKLKIDNLIIILGKVLNEDVSGDIINDEHQKKSFLYNIFSTPANTRTIVLLYMYEIFNNNLFNDKIKYQKIDNINTEIFLEGNIGENISIAVVKNTEIQKLENQVVNKVYSTIEEGLLRNLMALYNLDNEYTNDNAINYFVMLILGEKGMAKQTDSDKYNILDYMLPFFIEKTILE